jgi:hypothetical protein
MTTSMQTAIHKFDLGSADAFVDPDTAASYLQTTRRHVLEMVRAGLDPHAKKKDWRLLLSELHAYMLRCDQRAIGAEGHCVDLARVAAVVDNNW